MSWTEYEALHAKWQVEYEKEQALWRKQQTLEYALMREVQVLNVVYPDHPILVHARMLIKELKEASDAHLEQLAKTTEIWKHNFPPGFRTL